MAEDVKVAASVPAPVLKAGTFWNYAWDTKIKDENGKSITMPVLALILNAKQLTRPKLNKDGSTVTEVKINKTTKGDMKQNVPVYEAYQVYAVKLYSEKWLDEKFIPSVEATALTAI